MNAKGFYKFASVTRVNEDCSTQEWTLKEWSHKIEANFEQHFFVVKNNQKDKRPDLMNKEYIYKDTLNSSQPWTDYQLRCNFPITMAVAPELFDPKHAWIALQIVRKSLLGPLGMATLDPDDWMYRPYTGIVHLCGAWTGRGGLGCFSLVRSLGIYPGIDISTVQFRYCQLIVSPQ